MAVSLKRVKCIHGKYGRLDCEHCIREEADYLWWERENDEMAHRDRIVREYLPATDREYQDHLAACGYGSDEGEPTWVGVEVDR